MTQISMSDLLSQETLRNPIAFYGRLREQEPLSHFTLEGQIAIGTLLQRLPHLRLACEPEQLSWNPVPYLRGLRALSVTF